MITDYFDTDFIILERTQAADGVGGFTDTWSEVTGSTFKGSFRLAKENEIQKSDRKANDKIFLMHCSTSPAITNKKRLRVGSTDYAIDWIRNVHDHHKKVQLTELGT